MTDVVLGIYAYSKKGQSEFIKDESTHSSGVRTDFRSLDLIKAQQHSNNVTDVDPVGNELLKGGSFNQRRTPYDYSVSSVLKNSSQADPLYIGVWREGTDGHYLWAGVDWDGFITKWQELSPNLRLIDIETYIENGIRKYNGVWREGTDGHYLWAGVEWDGFVTKWQELSPSLRLVDVETYIENGIRKYIGVWREGTDGHYLWAGVDWDHFVAKWQELSPNLRLIDVETYEENGTRKYIGIWREGTDAYALWGGADWDDFVAKWQEFSPNMRLIDVETYVENGTRKYTGVWREGTDGYYLWAGVDWDSFVAKRQELSPNMRLIDIEQYDHISKPPQVCPATSAWKQTFQEALDQHAVGYAWAIVNDGNIIDSGQHGYARAPWENVDAGIPFTAETIMPIASVSKPITAVALLSLLENDLSRLDKPFYPYVQDKIPVAGTGVETVTLRNLLTMKSGMQQQAELYGDYWQKMRNWLAKPLKGKPGIDYEYINGNFSILQAVIEKISGMKYADYLQQAVFAPMGITGMAPDPPSAKPTLTYRRDDFRTRGYSWPSITVSTAAGGWNASASDLARFLIGVNNNSVLGKTTTSKMFEEQLGWYTYHGLYGSYSNHNGGLVTGSGLGLSTGIIHLTCGYDAVLLVNTFEFQTINLMIRAFETKESDPVNCDTEKNIALNNPADASSNKSSDKNSDKALDGDDQSYWSSEKIKNNNRLQWLVHRQRCFVE